MQNLLYLSASDLAEASRQAEERLANGWQDLIRRVCREPGSSSAGWGGLPLS
jgi:hypothetical protein